MVVDAAWNRVTDMQFTHRAAPRRRRTARRMRLGLEPLEMRALLDAAAGAFCADWLDTSDMVVVATTAELTSVETAPRAASATALVAATFEVFASDDQLAEHLIDLAIKRYEHVFGSPAFPIFPYESMEVFLTVDDAEPTSAAVRHSDTNVQVEGVDEADIVETDGRYIYTISRGELVIVDPQDPADLKLISRTELAGFTDQMYLHGDRLTLVSSSSFSLPRPQWGAPIAILEDSIFRDEPWTPEMTVTVLDVSNRELPRMVSTSTLEGQLIDSRMDDGRLYLVTVSDLDFPHPEIIHDEAGKPPADEEVPTISGDALTILHRDHWLPEGRYETREEYLARVADQILELSLPTFHTTDADGNVVNSGQIASAGNLYKSEVADQNGIASVSTLDTTLDTGSIASSSFMSTGGIYNHQLYATQSSLYVLETLWTEGASTRITRFSLADADGNPALILTGIGTVQGTVLNSFSMDEFDGYLRVATTSGGWRESVNHLFVLDANTAELKLVGRIDDIAPGEQIRSARFQGDEAVIVTFRQVDPLFGLDLSDPANPRILGELKINGFSSYLQFIGEDHLIGVGYDADPETGMTLGLQVSVFDVSSLSSPVLVDRFIFTDMALQTDATHDHHAITYLPEDGLLAIGLSSQWWPRLWGWPGDQDESSGSHDLYIFEVDTATGIELDAMIEHRSEVSRSTQIGDSLISMSDTEVVSISLADYQVQDRLTTHTVAIADKVVVDGNLSPHDEPAADERAGEPMVTITVEVVDSNGERTDELAVDQQATINIYVEDIRPDARGVFSATVDLNYDPGLVTLDETVEFGMEYQSATNVDFPTPGLVDELSAVGGFEASGPGRLILASLPFVGEIEGTAVFTLDPGESVNRETLVYGLNDLIDVDEIVYGTISIEIVDPSVAISAGVEAVDVNADGQVTPLDALLVINELDGVPRQAGSDAGSQAGSDAGSQEGSDAGSQEGLRAALASGTNKYDVNGDGSVTPLDALLVINFLDNALSSAQSVPQSARSISVATGGADVIGAGFILSLNPSTDPFELLSQTPAFEGEIGDGTARMVDALGLPKLAASANTGILDSVSPSRSVGQAPDSWVVSDPATVDSIFSGDLSDFLA
jgi:uncharacterized secreted protein with C-terminal beta-propeller domain